MNTDPPTQNRTTRNHVVQPIAIIPFVDKCHNIKIENPLLIYFAGRMFPEIPRSPKIDAAAGLPVNYRTFCCELDSVQKANKHRKKLHPRPWTWCRYTAAALSFCGGLVCICTGFGKIACEKNTKKMVRVYRTDALRGQIEAWIQDGGEGNCRDKILKFMDHWKLWRTGQRTF